MKNKAWSKSNQSGQILVIVMLLIVALIGMVGLAVDGGRLYSARRSAQSAADNAAMAGALALCTDGDVQTASLEAAAANEFVDADPEISVDVNQPPSSGLNSGDDEYVEVVINSQEQPGFIQLLYSGAFEVSARAVARCIEQEGQSYAIFANSTTCDKTIEWSGSDIVAAGGVHSNRSIYVSGSNNEAHGGTTYVTALQNSGGNNTYDPAAAQTSTQPLPITFNIADYAPGGSGAIAAQNDGNRYYSTTSKIDESWLISGGYYNSSTKVLRPGLYYTTNDIELGMGDLQADNVTFVGRKQISLNGSNQTLSPYADNLLLMSDLYFSSPKCVDVVVKVSGSDVSWQGFIYAPYGQIEVSGLWTQTLISGSLIGNTVKLSGSSASGTSMNIDPGPNLFPSGPGIISMDE